MELTGYIKLNNLPTFFNKGIMARLVMQDFMCNWYNRDVYFTSIFRGKDHNADVGGVKYSKHLDDCAFDFHYPDEWVSWDEVRRASFRQNMKNYMYVLHQKYGVNIGLILYNDRNCIHMDICDRDSMYIHDMWE